MFQSPAPLGGDRSPLQDTSAAFTCGGCRVSLAAADADGYLIWRNSYWHLACFFRKIRAEFEMYKVVFGDSVAASSNDDAADLPAPAADLQEDATNTFRLAATEFQPTPATADFSTETEKMKVNLYFSITVKRRIEKVRAALRQITPVAAAQGVNFSTITKIALEIAMDDFDRHGEASALNQGILRQVAKRRKRREVNLRRNTPTPEQSDR